MGKGGAIGGAGGGAIGGGAGARRARYEDCRRCCELDEQLERAGTERLRVQLGAEQNERELCSLRGQLSEGRARQAKLEFQVRPMGGTLSNASS